MLKGFSQLLLALFSLVIFFITLNNTANATSISPKLNALLKNVNPSVQAGVFIQSPSTGHIYYAKNDQALFAPASVQKLFTVTAALKTLGPNFRYPTKLYTHGSIKHGVLHGNVIFKFSGDPSFTRKNLLTFVKKLKAIGVHSISGNVVIDNKAFIHIPYPPGWTWDDLSFDFAAPLNTIVIDRNRFGLSFIPADKIGRHAILIPHLPRGTATFINQTTTTRFPKRNCPLTIYSNEDNQYLIRGCLPRNLGRQGRSLAIRNMEMFTSALIRELFRQNGINFHGSVYDAETPMHAKLISTHESAPLKHIIIHLLKHSDNLYADALFKKLGEQFSHAPGSWKTGLAGVKHVLTHNIGINLNNAHLNDGAGLSRYNAITPRAIGQLLHYIHHNPMLHSTIIPALPIAGVDGTLSGRMPSLARHKLLHAKTGSMTGVSTLAGFVKTKTHGVLAFVIMFNNIPKNREPYLWMENHICEFLARS